MESESEGGDTEEEIDLVDLFGAASEVEETVQIKEEVTA